MTADDVADPVRAADGRIAGRRALATRSRLLAATSSLLEERSYREVTVIDIARQAETSPATFYQYFPDVGGAILALAEEAAGALDDLGPALAAGRWRGRAGYEQALALSDRMLTHWAEHRAALRVVDLAAVEGDERFRRLRIRMLNGVIVALRDLIAERRGDDPDLPDPAATAGIIVAMLTQVAAHREGFEAWGAGPPELRRSLADIITWSVTGRRPVRA